jgi:hypothetical protein
LVLVCTPGIAKDLSKRGHPDWVKMAKFESDRTR